LLTAEKCSSGASGERINLVATWPPDLPETMGEWTDSVELAENVVERVRLAEKRSSQAQYRLHDVEARLGQEITGLQVRLRAAEQVIERLEAARSEAEAQAPACFQRPIVCAERDPLISALGLAINKSQHLHFVMLRALLRLARFVAR
jgi:hypothetical protein